jgi:hypothetical protein
VAEKKLKQLPLRSLYWRVENLLITWDIRRILHLSRFMSRAPRVSNTSLR